MAYHLQEKRCFYKYTIDINAQTLTVHNLEIPGSSPGWSTLKIKHLRRFRRCFFFDLRTPCEHRKYFQTSHEHREILRTRFWCSQNTQSPSFEKNSDFQSNFSAELSLFRGKTSFRCSQVVFARCIIL